MDRRDFLKVSCAACAVAVTGAALIESCTKQNAGVNFTVDITTPANAALNNVGGYVYASNSIIIARVASPLASLSFVALSQICTHNSCNVAYTVGSGTFDCPCHGGRYDQNGKVISGPPPSPLTKYNVSLSGNILTVTS